MPNEREEYLEKILANFLEPMKGIPFEIIIRALYGVTVEKFDKDASWSIRVMHLIVESMRSACYTVQSNPIEKPRPNEVGNAMEPFVIQSLKDKGLNAASPKTKTGKGKSTGYPDILLEIDDKRIFIEVKTYAAANYKTTQRSFYLSPTDDPKLFENGYHLLVGFEIERNRNKYKPVAFEIVDLYGLECDMKSEFNSDNRRLYESNRLLFKEYVV